jgi:L,D-transpeptidase ErfK/SrfK
MIIKVKKNQKIQASLACLLLAFTLSAFKPLMALTFPLPAQGEDIVGEMQTTTVRKGESLGEIGRRFDVGIYEMIEANPNLDPWVPMVGAIALIPTQFILPKGPRVGLVLNLAEMRLYYFHPDQPLVTTHPLGVGKKGWSTPLGQAVITKKTKDPAWFPPNSIRQEHLEKGDILPPVVPGGPDNPLGRYAFYLASKGLSSKGSFLIHGTNRPGGVGVRSSHGCIRLFPEDIESLYYTVPTGTAVRIIHEPYKVGWHKSHLYLEAHQPLTEAQYLGSDSLTRLASEIEKSINSQHLVNWTSAKMAAKTANGYPVRID